MVRYVIHQDAYRHGCRVQNGRQCPWVGPGLVMASVTAALTRQDARGSSHRRDCFGIVRGAHHRFGCCCCCSFGSGNCHFFAVLFVGCAIFFRIGALGWWLCGSHIPNATGAYSGARPFRAFRRQSRAAVAAVGCGRYFLQSLGSNGARGTSHGYGCRRRRRRRCGCCCCCCCCCEMIHRGRTVCCGGSQARGRVSTSR